MSKDIRNMSTEEVQAFMKSPEWASECAARKEQQAQILAAWKLRHVKKLNALSFVGKAYRSRGRRSADKVTAWAVNPPACTAEAAALGTGFAFEFADMVAHSQDSKFCGLGYMLGAVIVGMADAMAKAGPDEREQHMACIRGFAGVLESCASSWLACHSDSANAEQHKTRLAQLSEVQVHMRVNNAASRTRQNKAFTHELITGVEL